MQPEERCQPWPSAADSALLAVLAILDHPLSESRDCQRELNGTELIRRKLPAVFCSFSLFLAVFRFS